MEKDKGFSLIELIVVITIIAVITAVGVVSFGGANKKSRDSKRMADLERYRVALEMARQTNGIYPANLDDLVPNFIPQKLDDPKKASGYAYVYYKVPLNDYAYGLWACVEDVGSSNGLWTSTSCNGGACNCSSDGCNYRVLNP